MRFLLSDHIGSVVAVLDLSASVVEARSYFPYGTPRVSASVTPSNEAYGFQDKERAADGLADFGRRHLLADFPAFASVDPVFVALPQIDQPFDQNILLAPQKLNAYVQVNNNPLKFVDPDGRYIESAWDAFSISLGLVSLKQNLLESNYLAAATDVAGLLLDGAALALPVPGGAGAALKIAREGGEVLAKTTSDGVDLTLRYKTGWSDAQRAAADAKAEALTRADTVVTPSPVRSGTNQARYRREQNLGPGIDADHTVDLQLGGADNIGNISALDSSVNRSIGTQINNQIRNLPAGTRVNKVKMEDR